MKEEVISILNVDSEDTRIIIVISNVIINVIMK